MPPLEFYLKFVEIEYEIWALGEQLATIEPQLKFLREQGEVQTHARLREEDAEDDEGERQLAYQELWDRTEQILPRYFRGAFLIAVWALYEASVAEIAEHHRIEKKLALRIDEIRGGTVFGRAQRYYDAILHEELDRKPERLVRLADLYEIRNVLAHANGQLRWVSPGKAKELGKIFARYPGLLTEREMIVPTAEYARAAYEDVKGSLSALINRAKPERFRSSDAGEA